jgi:hypothetical protein
MWIFTRYGFFSIANGRNADDSPDPGVILVRARRMAHMTRLQQRCPSLAAAEVTTTRHGSYRIAVSKPQWLAALALLADEMNWRDFKAEAARFQGPGGAGYLHALNQVSAAMKDLQHAESRFELVNRDADGVITNAGDLTADDLVGERVWCPECHRKAFAAWPEGWDGHAGHACDIPGATPEERKAAYKHRYRRLFR